LSKIFIGFILAFINFNINIGNSNIGLFPDFIGYILIIVGLEEMVHESTFFIKIKPFVTGMAVYSGFLYFIDLIGASVLFGAMTYLLAIISTAISLYITYNIVMGVIDMEGKYNTYLNGENLKSTWKLLAIFNVITFVFLLIPFFAIISIVLSFIAAIYFLISFNNSKNLYYDIVKLN